MLSKAVFYRSPSTTHNFTKLLYIVKKLRVNWFVNNLFFDHLLKVLLLFLQSIRDLTYLFPFKVIVDFKSTIYQIPKLILY